MSDPRYRTARWRRTRARVIARDGRRCSVPGCKTDMTQKYATHVDHIREVRDHDEFWDENNCRVVCKLHHFAKTYAVAAERGERESPNSY